MLVGPHGHMRLASWCATSHAFSCISTVYPHLLGQPPQVCCVGPHPSGGDSTGVDHPNLMCAPGGLHTELSPSNSKTDRTRSNVEANRSDCKLHCSPTPAHFAVHELPIPVSDHPQFPVLLGHDKVLYQAPLQPVESSFIIVAEHGTLHPCHISGPATLLFVVHPTGQGSHTPEFHELYPAGHPDAAGAVSK